MTNSASGTRWLIAQLRATAFPDVGRDMSGEVGWWSEFAGAEPELRTTSKKLVGFQEEGDFNGGRLVLNVQLERIDWVFAASTSTELEVSATELPNVGEYPTSAEPFLLGMRRWLGKAPTIKRLAMGAVLLRPTSDRGTGYAELQKYLHSVRIDPVGMRDFFYQVNRRRKSSVLDDLELNRLSKWSVLASQRFSVSTSGVATVYEGAHAVRLELDINSALEYSQPIPEDRVVGLFDEFVRVAQEIAEVGDVP